MDDATGDVISKLVEHMQTTKAYTSELTEAEFTNRFQDYAHGEVAPGFYDEDWPHPTVDLSASGSEDEEGDPPIAGVDN